MELNFINIFVLVGCVFQLIFVLLFNKNTNRNLKLFFKLAASACFVVCGTLSIFKICDIQNNLLVNCSWLIYVGLICGFCGDFVIDFRHRFNKYSKPYNVSFILGIAFFFANHVLYLISMNFYQGSTLLPVLLIAGFLLSCLLVFIFNKINSIKKSYCFIGIVYFGVLFTLAIFAILFLFAIFNYDNKFDGNIRISTCLFSIGILFYVIADSFTAFKSFVLNKKFRYYKLINIIDLPLYYIGQMLIAYSLFFVAV